MQRALHIAMCLGAATGAAAAQAAGGPSVAMMEPVRALAACMARSLPDDCALPFATAGVTIQENFAPFVFGGRTAVNQWRSEFRRHLAAGGDSQLAVRFGPAQDFDQVSGRVFFSLPATWTGVAHGRPFAEDGAWSFVLVESAGRYRILAYAWGVTALRAIRP